MAKICSRCLKKKIRNAFYARPTATDGLRSHCKSCILASQRRNKKYKSRYDKTRYSLNRGRILRRAKAYYKSNRESRKLYEKRILPRILAQRRERYHSDLNFKLASNLRARIWSALRGRTKTVPTMELLGCTIPKLREHIEGSFTKGMTWEKIKAGQIHIDHVRPIVSFDLTDPRQQRECFHYSNLRPLWKAANLKRPKWSWKG